MKRFSQAGFYFLILFYILAGINHFYNPAFYLPLIPPYLPNAEWINIASGIAEIALGVGLIFPRTRRIAAFGIILMLIAFLPAHIWLIQKDGCVGELCVSPWIAWVRLLVVHPLLMYWAWSYRNYTGKAAKN